MPNTLRFHFTPFALALIACLAPSAEAKQGDVALGFDVGGTRFDEELVDDTEVRFSIRGGYMVTDRFGLELEASRTSNGLSPSLDTLILQAFIPFDTGSRFTPFVTAGAGYAELDHGGLFSEGERHTGPVAQAGGGVLIDLGSSSRVGLRLEAGVLAEELEEDVRVHSRATVGLQFRLGD
jgi:opacity protein-like surface antigen